MRHMRQLAGAADFAAMDAISNTRSVGTVNRLFLA
jgi:hypothetical protein